MNRRPSLLQVAYATLATTGLLAVTIPAAMVDGGAFVHDVFANAATTTVTLDLLVLGVAAVVFVVVEAGRLGMPRRWWWVVAAVPLPGAFLVPLFLVLRERRLAGAAQPVQ